MQIKYITRSCFYMPIGFYIGITVLFRLFPVFDFHERKNRIIKRMFWLKFNFACIKEKK